jgi:hypothetical protein
MPCLQAGVTGPPSTGAPGILKQANRAPSWPPWTSTRSSWSWSRPHERTSDGSTTDGRGAGLRPGQAVRGQPIRTLAGTVNAHIPAALVLLTVLGAQAFGHEYRYGTIRLGHLGSGAVRAETECPFRSQPMRVIWSGRPVFATPTSWSPTSRCRRTAPTTAPRGPRDPRGRAQCRRAGPVPVPRGSLCIRPSRRCCSGCRIPAQGESRRPAHVHRCRPPRRAARARSPLQRVLAQFSGGRLRPS